jgi:hypothetical protein
MRISSLLAHLTQKLTVYYLFLSRRNINTSDSRNAEQTNLSFLRHGNYVTVFVLHFCSSGSVGTFRAVLSREPPVDYYLIKSCVWCRSNVSEISKYWRHELQERTWIVDRK